MILPCISAAPNPGHYLDVDAREKVLNVWDSQLRVKHFHYLRVLHLGLSTGIFDIMTYLGYSILF